jgi:hypothetical protein
MKQDDDSLHALPRDWEDVAFHGRHKGYGAYSLRRNYRRGLAYAFLLTNPVFIIIIWFLNGTQAHDIDVVAPNYVAYYYPRLPMPPIETDAKYSVGVGKRVTKKAPSDHKPVSPNSSQLPPVPIEQLQSSDNNEVEPEPEEESNTDLPSEGQYDVDSSLAPQSVEGDNVDSSSVKNITSFGAHGSATKKLFLHGALVTDDGEETLHWFVDDDLQLVSRRINVMNQDIRNIFGLPGFVDKGLYQYYVRVNQLQAVNVAFVSDVETTCVVLITGDKIGVDYQYMRKLKKHLKFYEDTYGN